VVHPDFPRNQNIGVMVNNTFYYPGDSFTEPGQPVAMLAVPVSAPWLKTAETIDFVRAVKPKHCFPTHNALLSQAGHNTVNTWTARICEPLGTTFTYLQPGESTEV